jgi:hypothetical protein
MEKTLKNKTTSDIKPLLDPYDNWDHEKLLNECRKRGLL